MHVACQIRKAHESGNARTNREEVPRRWSDSLQLRPGGWSESPQWVERIAPLGSLPPCSRGNSAHQSGNSRTNREIRARIGKFAHELTHRLGRISREMRHYHHVPGTPSGQPSATRSASSGGSRDYRQRSPQAWPTASNDFAMVCVHGGVLRPERQGFVAGLKAESIACRARRASGGRLAICWAMDAVRVAAGISGSLAPASPISSPNAESRPSFSEGS